MAAASFDFNACLKIVLDHYELPFNLKEKQVEALENTFNLHDTLCNLPTGYGKSMIYQLLPALFNVKYNKKVAMDGNAATKCCVLVISPLNAIQVDQLEDLASLGVKACRLTTECHALDKDSKPVEMFDVSRGRYEIIFCHPEALFATQKGQDLVDDPDFQEMIAAVVIDECHKVDDW